MSIQGFKHKGLATLFETERSGKIQKAWHARILAILDFLDVIEDLDECVGFRDFHPLTGDREGQFSMSVTGNWRIVFTLDFYWFIAE